jgi:tetratricopeptide (TPR) repeat protein
MVSRTLLAIVATAILAACAGPVSKPVQVKPEPSTPAAREDTRSAGDASASLLGQARAARLAGDFTRSEVLLQRAQRIDPHNAVVYLEYARLYAAHGNMEDARTMAERGLLYCDSRSCAQLRELAHP